MLSNIKSYLFGNSGNAEEDIVTGSPIEFKEVEDEDWMIVDASGTKGLENCENDDDLIVSEQLFDDNDESLSENSNNHNDDQGRLRRRSNSFKDIYHRQGNFTPLRELSPSNVMNSLPHPSSSLALSLSITKSHGAKSRSPSRSSSQCFMEESWFVTPPPCFVAEPYDTKPSSLENLLIENPGLDLPLYTIANTKKTSAQLLTAALTTSSLHCEESNKKKDDRRQNLANIKPKAPSTTAPAANKSGQKKKKSSNDNNNVVHQFSRSSTLKPLKQLLFNDVVADRSSSNFIDNRIKTDSQHYHAMVTMTRTEEQLVSDRKQRRKSLIRDREDRKVMNALQSQLNCGQKSEQILATQHLKRNQLEKQNKVQFELTSRKKRQRRADLNMKHSGANNNRKCCY